MIIAITCFVFFLFILYQLAKDDFLFLRRGITTEDVFNTLFLSLPVIFIFSRLFYVLQHLGVQYFNPLVFFLVMYFPGLSFFGAVIGLWIFSAWYIERKKMPGKRFLDMVGISYIGSFGVWILFFAIGIFLRNKLLGMEEAGRGIVGLAFFVILLLGFLKNKWREGSSAYLSVTGYCLLAFIPSIQMVLSHQKIPLVSIGLTAILFIMSSLLFLRNERRVS